MCCAHRRGSRLAHPKIDRGQFERAEQTSRDAGYLIDSSKDASVDCPAVRHSGGHRTLVLRSQVDAQQKTLCVDTAFKE
jgi:hypothetical protein